MSALVQLLGRIRPMFLMEIDAGGGGGQGGGDTPGIFDSYLQAVPEDARETVAGYLKDAEKNVNSRIESAANLEKTWAPFKEVQDTLTSYDPETLSELLAWHQQMAASPEAFSSWLAREAQAAGLTPAQEDALADAEQQGELTRDEVQKLVTEAAQSQVAPVQEKLDALEQDRQLGVEFAAIEQAFTALEREAGRKLSPEERAVIVDLGTPYSRDDKGNELPEGNASWIKAGFDRWKEIATAGQRAFVEDKTGGQQPGAALATGGTAAFKPTTDYKSAGEQLRERLRQSAAT
jgi:hypothetical protein